MLKLMAYGALASVLIHNVQSIPFSSRKPAVSILPARGLDNWQSTLSNDTRYRLDVARQHLEDKSGPGQAFRNDTIMRVNIEREALDLSLIDLSQAFGMTLPTPRDTVNKAGSNKRSNSEDFREESYLRSGTMTYPQKRSNSEAEDFREESYLRSGTMTYPQKRSNSEAEDFREESYLRSGTMTYPQKRSNSEAEDFREESYLRSGTMTYPQKRSNYEAEDFREESYLRSGTMTYPQRRHNPDEVKNSRTKLYRNLLNRDNLALGAIERINVAHRILGKPEITIEQAKEIGSHGDEYITAYWNSSMKHGDFWTDDQAYGKPNFIEGGQSNGFGFTQSTFHKLHCLANIRMMLAWHITGNGSKMTRDMNVHTMHCLEYIRHRELAHPDLNEEPIDTVDYKGMGIH